MSMLWPGFLWLLALVPALVAAYIWAQRRRRRFAVKYSSLALLRDVVPAQSWMRRHLPPLLLLTAFTSLAFSLMRPVSIIAVPTGQSTIVLAIDVSRSMCSTDVAP